MPRAGRLATAVCLAALLTAPAGAAGADLARGKKLLDAYFHNPVSILIHPGRHPGPRKFALRGVRLPAGGPGDRAARGRHRAQAGD